MIKLLNKFYKFFKAKKDFLPPKKKRVLIFDGNNNPFKSYISQKNFETLYTRGEKINLFILLKCIYKKKFQMKYYFEGYIKEYIKYVNPKIILTFIDNSRIFYTIHNITNCKIVFVQNGIRSEWSDIFSEKKVVKKSNLKNFKVNYMFVFNNAIGKLYNSFIQGKFIAIGSFNNNIRKKNKIKKKKEILVISTYRTYGADEVIEKNKNITWGEFTKNDHFFIKWLKEFAENDKININILAKYPLKETKKEYEFFKSFLKNNKFNYIENSPDRDVYRLVDSYEYIFTIDSTLGIESFSRGVRTGFFANRPNTHPIVTRKFGWMEKLPSRGPFWTHLNDKKEFHRIYKTVVNPKNKKWKNIFKKYNKKIMPYDPGNKIFKNILKKTLSE